MLDNWQKLFSLDPCWEVHSDGACRKDGRSAIGFVIHAVIRPTPATSVRAPTNTSASVAPIIPLVPLEPALVPVQHVSSASENKRRKTGGAWGTGGVGQNHTAISACIRDDDDYHDDEYEYGYCERILVHCSGFAIDGNTSSLTSETLAISKALEYLNTISIYHRTYTEEKQTISYLHRLRMTADDNAGEAT